MKNLKKILAVLLTLAMVLGMSITTFAADEKIGNSDDTATITVKGITDEGVTVKAYPIIKTTYGENDHNFSGYEVLYTTNPEIELTLKSGKAGTNTAIYEYTLSNEQIAQIRAKLSDTVGGGPIDMRKDASGDYVADAPIGAYLVVVSDSETSTYNAMVVSTNYKNDNGVNAIDSSKATAEAKKSDVPSVDKVIVKNDEDVKGSTENIGDEVDYKVTINPVPDYTGKYPVLNAVDTLSTGLTYNTGSLSVKVVKADNSEVTLTENTHYVLTVEDQTITVNFVKVVDGTDTYLLKDYVGAKVVITYKATVNENAKLNEVGNNNHVVLTYSKDSTITGDGSTGADEDITHTYTFDIDGDLMGEGSTGEYKVNVLHILNKIGEEIGTYTDESSTTHEYKLPLEGAEFTVYTDANCTQVYKNTKFQGTVTSDKDGQLHITGLEAAVVGKNNTTASGTYYIKETKAPAGYSLNDTPIKVQINATIDATTGELTAWNVKINDENGTTFSATRTKTETETTWERTETTVVDGNHEGYNIANTRINELPSTGGIGTTIFTVAGCIIMIVAAGLFFATRRKRA